MSTVHLAPSASWKAIVGVFAVLTVTACGIPQIVILESPTLISVQALLNIITIEHDTDNNIDDFLGYEIYYKFYDPGTSATEFLADRFAIEAASPGTALSIISQRGYYRVHPFPDTDEIPSVAVSATQRSQEFTIDIEFPDDPPGNPTTEAHADSTSTPAIDQELIRDQSVLTDADQGFTSAEVNLSDEDIPTVASVPIDGLIDMGVVVLAYGVDFTNGTFAQVTSQPLVIPELLRIFFE